MPRHGQSDRILLRALGQVGRLVMDTGDEAVVASRFVEVVLDGLGLYGVQYLRVHSELGAAELVARAGLVPVELGHRYGLDSGRIGRCVRSRSPVVSDASRDPEPAAAGPEGAAEVVLPVWTDEELTGVLVGTGGSPGSLDEALDELQSASDRLGWALEYARLVRERAAKTERLSSEARIRAEHLEFMQDVAHATMSGADLGGLLQRVAATVSKRFVLAMVTVVTVDGDEFVLEACAGRRELEPGTRWPITAGITARCYRTGKAQWVLDVDSDPDYHPDFDDIRAQVSLPISASGRRLGVITLQATDPARFDDETRGVLSTLADQIAGAVHMAWANRTVTELFGRYVSPELARQLLDDPDRYRTEGERRHGTVMFADIRGFTAVSQRVPADLLVALLNDYFSAVGEAIFAERGSITRYLGDGFMAAFGAPEPLSDHAAAAVRAGRAVLRAAEALSPRWEAIAGSPLEVVLAINSGELILGTIGDPRHMEWTVLGDVVNVAARLEAEAKRLGVRLLVTETTALAAGVEGEPLASLQLRGRQGEVVVYDALATR